MVFIPINCPDHGNLAKPVRFLMTQRLVEDLVDDTWDANEEGVAQVRKSPHQEPVLTCIAVTLKNDLSSRSFQFPICKVRIVTPHRDVVRFK